MLLLKMEEIVPVEGVIVSVEEGKLRGIKNQSCFSGVEFYSFYGVPYGEPPIGNLRFKDPVAVKPWKSIRNATIESKRGCRQFSLNTFTVIGSEDCLYNNIHTSKLPSEDQLLLPVIVCIHPGGFQFGSPESDHYGSPDFVMHHNIVYVCIAWRLHILGFLNLNMKECSGNQGLKDIVLGLQWIKKNIHNFNGDPNNVTLIGSSCGGIIIHLLMLSPAAKGLFHKVVLTSYVFSPYTTFEDQNESIAFEIASKLGFHGTDHKKLLIFLKKTPAEAFFPLHLEYKKSSEKTTAVVFPQSVFLPTVDSASEHPVIPVTPRKLINSIATVPMIYGCCDREAILAFCSETLRKSVEKNYRKAYRQSKWGWMHELDDDEIRMINDEVEAYFFKDYPRDNVPSEVKEKMLTAVASLDLYDTLIKPVAAKLPASVYVYKFRYESDLVTMKTVVSKMMNEEMSGTYHSCDYPYWSNMKQTLSERSSYMIQIYTKLITTFARYGNPNYKQLGIEWTPTTVENPCYLIINETLEMTDGEVTVGVELWKDIKRRFKKE